MASRNYAPIRALARGQVIIDGSFIGNAGASPTSTRGNGITSITWVATGRYRINFTGRFERLLDFSACVLPGTTGTTTPVDASGRVVNALQPLNTTVTVNGRSVRVTQVEVFVTENDAAPLLINLAATDQMTFKATFQNSKARPRTGR
jgi:hypothetical protein